MSVKLTLQNLSDWIKDSSTAAKGAVELTLESGLLKDSLEDLVELGGVTGALFKLGSRAIPDPTPEQRIAARLHKAFLGALDYELKENSIEEGGWKKYMRERLSEVATEKLSGEFTWLSIFGSRGRKPGRSWPIVGELADLGRTWVAEMAAVEGHSSGLQRRADDTRGRIHETLAKEVDKLFNDQIVFRAINEAITRIPREALNLLAQELTTLKRYRLFGEIPQEAVYVSPKIKVADFKDTPETAEFLTRTDGDIFLFRAIRNLHPRLVVMTGEMGAGKSCLIRTLAARLAEQFRSDRLHAPVYVRWRDIYDQPDLGRAIADQLSIDYGLPFHDLPDQENVIYLIDGFDEMSSHQEAYVIECFERLARLVRGRCSVVVTMRSTVIAPGLWQAFKHREALAVQVQDFDDETIEKWASKWSAHTGAEITGKRLRSLCGRDQSVAHNPLLLYMLAKYVDPVAREKQSLTRKEVFRIFVDETIRGKLRTSREEFPFKVPERDYRLLLQEMAWLASWPRHTPKCPARVVRDRIPESFLKDLSFQDIRTAFVLHFFEPEQLMDNEFEFQPDGFRQYLLAEWCMRAQFDSLKDESHPSHPLSRTRVQAIDALAQFPLRDQERSLLNEIYEELGQLSKDDVPTLKIRLAALGTAEKDPGQTIIHQLYEWVRDKAEEPPPRTWEDDEVGIPQGQEIPPGLKDFRLMLNYWDQCMIATLALFRGLRKDPRVERTFSRDPRVIGRFLHSWYVAREFTQKSPLKLSSISLANADLKGLALSQVEMEEVDLQGADLNGTDLNGANLVKANLGVANLTGVSLANANLTQANLRGANLRLANLDGADLNGADLAGAHVTQFQLKASVGRPRRLPDGSEPEPYT